MIMRKNEWDKCTHRKTVSSPNGVDKLYECEDCT